MTATAAMPTYCVTRCLLLVMTHWFRKFFARDFIADAASCGVPYNEAHESTW